jgi:hypothetical protein
MRQQPAEQLARALVAVLRLNGVNAYPTHVRIFLPVGPSVQLPVIYLPLVEPDSEEGGQGLRDAILATLDEAAGPLKTSAIARRAGRAYSGSFRATIKAMRESNEIVAVDDGYKLPEE